ncbi:MAG: glycosyltransferase involved in cell wall biosynthesis [Patiriisocius sp.]|jgi:glycosyltransferase involved in cell wall biosynthesis
MKTKPTKKILFLITKSNWGGAQRYVFDLATNLDLEIYEPVVAVGQEGELVHKLHQAGIRTISIPGLTRDISLRKELSATFSIANIIRKEKPDVLHVNSSKAGAIGSLLGRILFVPRILFTAHGWSFNEDRPAYAKIMLKTIHWLTVIFAHHTIAVSRAIHTQMDWLGTHHKMSVINPGRTIPDLKSKQEARGILETKVINSVVSLSEYHTDIWIGTIAELHPVKQLNRAIDAVASLSRDVPNVRYIIIGSGQCEEALRQQVADLGMDAHIFFTGALPEAARFIPAFDTFVLPSRSEAYGYVLLEAGMAKVPAVATNVGGVTDIITNGQTGLLVQPDNTPALRDAVHNIITDKKLAETFSDALYAEVQNRTVEHMTQQTSLLY